MVRNDQQTTRVTAESARAGEESSPSSPATFDALLREHQEMLEIVARIYARRFGRALYDDLLQEARLGLWDAMRGYDPSAGAAFGTYARIRVTGRIRQYLRDKAYAIRIPAWCQGTGESQPRAVPIDGYDKVLDARCPGYDAAETLLLLQQILEPFTAREQEFIMLNITKSRAAAYRATGLNWWSGGKVWDRFVRLAGEHLGR